MLGVELEDARAVGGLVFEVEFGIVGGVGLPHFPDDFEPSPAESKQGLGMALTFFAQRVVLFRGPGRLHPAFVGEEIHGMAQVLVAAPAHADFVDAAGLVAHGRGARQALQALRVVVERAITADEGPRRRPRPIIEGLQGGGVVLGAGLVGVG